MATLTVHDLTAAYAVDALDAQEAREYERHLANCERCQRELAELSEGAAALAFATDAPAPPLALRENILVEARRERGTVVPLRPRWTTAAKAVTAVAAAAAVVLGIWAGSLARSLDDERSARARADRALAVLSDPTAQHVSLNGPNRGELVFGPRGAVLVMNGLGTPQPGKTYEAGVIPAGGKPKPAGTFEPERATTVHELDEPVPMGATVAVTVERDGGVDMPTGNILLSAKAA